MTARRNLLVLYDAWSTFTQTVTEHLRSFRVSEHRVFYAHATVGAKGVVDLDAFDAVVVHYSVRLSLPSFLSEWYSERLAKFTGPKLLFIQDEYDATETARRWIERLGFDVVFTCVPPASIPAVYPPARFPKTRFVTVLTGYVPPRFESAAARRPISDRKLLIAYRGRPLPYWYGALGREKLEIGRRVKEICVARRIPVDIEWSEEARIYGEGWYDFLASAKATLGSESGANVFDEEGSIRKSIEAALAKDPSLSFEDAHARFVAPHEGKVRMNQISPKFFEAIALGTALVLFEGDYSGILEPNRHYLPLRKDFSNVDDVLRALGDDAGLQAMADRAWQDVIGSGRFSYSRAIAEVDAILRPLLKPPRAEEPFTVVFGTQDAIGSATRPTLFRRRHKVRDLMTSAPLVGPALLADAGYVGPLFRGVRRLWLGSGLARAVDRMRDRRR